MYNEYWKNNTQEMANRVINIKNLLKTNLPTDVIFSRKGSNGDGGYIIADDITEKDYVVSFGVDKNVDFEKSLSEYGCKLDLYDYSVDALPIEIENSRFFKEKIGIYEGETSLKETLDKAKNADIILKIDIEGAEWDAFATADLKDLSKCRQILVEFHWMNNMWNIEFYNKAMEAFGRLRETHTPVFVHANNNVPLMVIGNSPMPMVFEVLYLRTSSYKFPIVSDPFDGLVVKNDVAYPEIGLTFP